MADVLPNVEGDAGQLIQATPVVIVNSQGVIGGDLVNVAGKQSFTRPNDTTAYAAGDLIANDTTAGSVLGLAITGATLSGNGGSGTITSVLLNKTGTAVAQIRAHFLKTQHAVSNGDNGGLAFTSIDLDNYIGFADINLADVATGGVFGQADVSIDYELATGDTIYCFLEALAAYTPIAVAVMTVVAKFRRYA